MGTSACARRVERANLTRHDSNTVVVTKGARDLVGEAGILIFTLLTLVATLPAFGSDLKGRVINGTTRRAAAGDDVVLLSLSKDRMDEMARTQTDSMGRFHIPVADPVATHVVRVVHQGVTYHEIAQPDASSVSVEVYDVTTKVDDVTAVMDVERFEATNDQLEVKELVTMRNKSKPPRTLMKDRSFEFQLLPGAEVQYGLVQVEEEPPLKQEPIPGDHAGQYYFAFPMRPGDTRFAVVYRVPYRGQAMIQPTIRNRLERFVIMLPTSMKFEPTDPRVFQPMAGTTPDNAQGTEPVELDQTVSFHISGTGTLAELEGRRRAARENKARQTVPRPQPGGGLGAPIGTPDPLQAYRWPIMGGLAMVLLAGAMVVMARGHGRSAAQQPVSHKAPARQLPNQAQRRASASRNRRRRQRSHASQTNTH